VTGLAVYASFADWSGKERPAWSARTWLTRQYQLILSADY
jgi:hypothetical protein